jgi:hypothetical protein
MFFFTPISEGPSPKEKRSSRLLEIEQRMNEFLAQKAGDVGNEALDLIRLHRDEVRRERIGEDRRDKEA